MPDWKENFNFDLFRKRVRLFDSNREGERDNAVRQALKQCRDSGALFCDAISEAYNNAPDDSEWRQRVADLENEVADKQAAMDDLQAQANAALEWEQRYNEFSEKADKLVAEYDAEVAANDDLRKQVEELSAELEAARAGEASPPEDTPAPVGDGGIIGSFSYRLGQTVAFFQLTFRFLFRVVIPIAALLAVVVWVGWLVIGTHSRRAYVPRDTSSSSRTAETARPTTPAPETVHPQENNAPPAARSVPPAPAPSLTGSGQLDAAIAKKMSAAEAGDVYAVHDECVLYSSGLLQQQIPAWAVSGIEKWCAASADHGDGLGMLILATLYEKQGDKAKAADWYARAANSNDVKVASAARQKVSELASQPASTPATAPAVAQAAPPAPAPQETAPVAASAPAPDNTAPKPPSITGVPAVDADIAAHLSAAEAGDAKAISFECNEYGLQAELGYPLTLPVEAGIKKWCATSADHGDGLGMLYLAEFYERKGEKKEALAWYRRAAAAGLAGKVRQKVSELSVQ